MLCDCSFPWPDSFSSYISSLYKNNCPLKILLSSFNHASIYLIIHSTFKVVLLYAFHALLSGRQKKTPPYIGSACGLLDGGHEVSTGAVHKCLFTFSSYASSASQYIQTENKKWKGICYWEGWAKVTSDKWKSSLKTELWKSLEFLNWGATLRIVRAWSCVTFGAVGGVRSSAYIMGRYWSILRGSDE